MLNKPIDQQLKTIVSTLPFVSHTVTFNRADLGSETTLLPDLTAHIRSLLDIGISPLAIKRALAKAQQAVHGD